jgi:TRAP-type C4-dicarboxylate transport system permease large subunit
MTLLIFVFLVVLIAGVPVFIALAGSSLIYTHFLAGIPDFVILHRMAGGIDSFPLLAVPFFILAGNLMNSAGITNRIYDFAVALCGWMRGGLAHVNIIGSVIFAGMSGTAIADAAGLGTIEIKAMKDHGYGTEFSVGVTAASATLGPIIPPSLPFVIYGMMANVSIGALFLGGVIPGVVMTLFMMATVAYFAHKNGWGSDSPFSWRQLGSAGLEIFIVLAFPMVVWLLVVAGMSVNMAVGIGLVALLALDWYFDFSAVMALMAPVILIGGMTLGWFTPTEAAVAAVIWSLFLGLVRYRSMTLQTVAKATFDTIETTASVLFIVTAASIFAWLLTVSQAAQTLTDVMLGITHNKWVFLLLANILILFVGCFIDTIAAITILVPILLPIVLKLGIDPIHFGLIMTLNLMIGLLHPPLGMVLFVLARVAKLSVERTTMAILPWLVPLLLALVAITYIPELTLWLPKYMGLSK